MKQVKGIDAKDYCLYELTERDLTYLVDHDYHIGNILIFGPNNKAKLGREIGRANNLKAAEEFLASLAEKSIGFPLENEPTLAGGTPSPASSSTSPTGGTPSLISSNPSLIEQYEELRGEGVRQYEKRIEELTIEVVTLQKANAEKSKRVDELSFLSLQNDIQREELINDLKEVSNVSAVKAVVELDELRVKIIELETQLDFEKNACTGLESTIVLLSAEKSVLEHELNEAQKQLDNSRKPNSFNTATENEQELILTNSSGGVIHIYHEFPPIPKHSIGKRLFSRARLAFFVIMGTLVVAYIFYLNSVLDTMRASGIDVSAYSDAVLGGIRSLFGF